VINYLPEWWDRASLNALAPNGTVTLRLQDLCAHHGDLWNNDLAWILNITTGSELDFVNFWKTKFEIQAPVRTEFIYFNLGFTVLAAVAEKVTNQDWSTIFRERLIDKLGLQGELFFSTLEALGPNYAYGHALSTDLTTIAVPREFNTIIDNVVRSAGAYAANTAGMTKFFKAFHNQLNGVVSIDRYVQLTSAFQSTYPFDNEGLNPFHYWLFSYAFGLNIGVYNGHKAVMHPGTTIGQAAFFITFPDDKISIGMAWNQYAISFASSFFFGCLCFRSTQGL